MPTALVHVESSTRWQFDGVEYDRLLTPECLSPSELDHQIDRLHAELEKVRQEGKKEFARTQGKVGIAASDGFRSPPQKAS